jgi:ABC-type bacteriocin/lantibiotic exporter with double-glycine peptidase domain
VLPNVLSALVSIAILALGGARVIAGEMSVGMLVAFQSLMASFLQPVTNLMGLAGTLQEAEGDLARLDDVLNHPVQVATAAGTAPVAAAASSSAPGSLELRDVTFGYSKLEPPLIEHFNLRIGAGQRIALVGGSGSGKSTVARLAMGVHEPWSGEVLIDGVPRAEWPPARLHATLGGIDQDIVLFGGTVRDNLSLWDATLPQEDLIEATRDACIHDVIAARSGGYEAEVGESGANFSGGQRQRLEIARALAAKPRILVMDEATAALDAMTEEQIDANVRRRGCACLIVAHRLSTLRDCEEIVVLAQGKVAERGTHAELMALRGAYHDLIEAGR